MAGSHPLLHWDTEPISPYCQRFTCFWTLAYENATCFGISFCRLLSLGERGGLLHPVCPQPAGCLSRLGLYIPGCLQSIGPCVQCILVGSGACVWAARCLPQPAGGVPGSGPLMGSKSTVIIHPSIHPSIYTYIHTGCIGMLSL